MKFVSSLMRYILNINTIWGLMILISFFACVAQHYMPTTTTLPAVCFGEGESTVAIEVAGKKDQVAKGSFVVAVTGDAIEIRVDEEETKRGMPYPLSVERVGEGVVLKWDHDGPGVYTLSVNGSPITTGKLITLGSLTDAAFDYAQIGFDIALGLVASMVLFLGLMKVGEDAGIVQLVARGFYPIIRFLFPDVPKDHPASGAILMNWTTTLLGLGNAATPFGLKAMKELQSLNKHPEIATDSQVMLLGYNTAGLALLPTTLIAVRKSAGCSDPFEIIGTCMIAGATATITAIVMVKLLGKLPIFSRQAAIAELAREGKPATETNGEEA